MIQDGETPPIVAIMAPRSPAICIPTKVAALIAIGPGVICEIVIISVNPVILNQPFCTTTCSSIRGNAAYPPPKLNRPI